MSEDSMSKEDIDMYLDTVFEATEKMLPKVAKLLMQLKNELVKEGFTEEQAIQICANYKMK